MEVFGLAHDRGESFERSAQVALIAGAGSWSFSSWSSLTVRRVRTPVDRLRIGDAIVVLSLEHDA